MTNIPGTTRDTVEECALIRGIQFRLTDTAGMREDAADEVETFGIARSRESLKRAEIIVWLLDPERNAEEQLSEMKNATAGLHAKCILCWNKLDLIHEKNIELQYQEGSACVRISAKTGVGMEDLFDRLEKEVRADMPERESEIAVAQRHEALLETAREQ